MNEQHSRGRMALVAVMITTMLSTVGFSMASAKPAAGPGKPPPGQVECKPTKKNPCPTTTTSTTTTTMPTTTSSTMTTLPPQDTTTSSTTTVPQASPYLTVSACITEAKDGIWLTVSAQDDVEGREWRRVTALTDLYRHDEYLLSPGYDLGLPVFVEVPVRDEDAGIPGPEMGYNLRTFVRFLNDETYIDLSYRTDVTMTCPTS